MNSIEKLYFHFLLFIPFKSKRLHAMQIIRCKREMPQMEVPPQCTQKLYVGRKADWVLKFSCFFGFQESRGIGYSKISREFSRNFTSRSRSRGIFISLFTSRKEWIKFSFHFSFLEKSESYFHFTFHFSSFQYPLSQDTVGGKPGDIVSI